MVNREFAQSKERPHIEFKGLTNNVAGEVGPPFRFCRATETRRGQSVDSTMVVGKSTEKKGQAVLNLKDLLAVSPPSGARPFRSCRATETWRGLSADSRRVVGEVSEENGRSSAQSKGLANGVSAEP